MKGFWRYVAYSCAFISALLIAHSYQISAFVFSCFPFFNDCNCFIEKCEGLSFSLFLFGIFWLNVSFDSTGNDLFVMGLCVCESQDCNQEVYIV